MRIKGGSFGIEGNAHISRDNYLVIEAATESIYSPEQITTVNASSEKTSKFGVIGFILGAVILSILFGMFLNIIGVVIGIILAFVGSKYSKEIHYADVTFNDNKSIKLECTARNIQKVIALS